MGGGLAIPERQNVGKAAGLCRHFADLVWIGLFPVPDLARRRWKRGPAPSSASGWRCRRSSWQRSGPASSRFRGRSSPCPSRRRRPRSSCGSSCICGRCPACGGSWPWRGASGWRFPSSSACRTGSPAEAVGPAGALSREGARSRRGARLRSRQPPRDGRRFPRCPSRTVRSSRRRAGVAGNGHRGDRPPASRSAALCLRTANGGIGPLATAAPGSPALALPRRSTTAKEVSPTARRPLSAPGLALLPDTRRRVFELPSRSHELGRSRRSALPDASRPTASNVAKSRQRHRRVATGGPLWA